jgi:3-deoxy-manno-octulosonate cytidylyltransferase (CMP-KDO synthetase)
MALSAILIPARYESTRFPGKPLVELDGVPMIKRVYNTCASTGLDTFVLTDDKRIGEIFDEDDVIYTSPDAENGTERVCMALEDPRLKYYEQFVNVQGDMPDVTGKMIDTCIWHLKHYPIVTLYTEMKKDLQNDPNSVKLIRSGDKCLWFGRGMTGYGDWHLGVYGYRRNPLEFYMTYEIEQEEQIEKLEQLRWLKAGWDIGCMRVDFNGIEINAPEDVELWHNKNFH